MSSIVSAALPRTRRREFVALMGERSAISLKFQRPPNSARALRVSSCRLRPVSDDSGVRGASVPAKGEPNVTAVNPYLNFDGNAEEAFRFYRSVFGGEYAVVVRIRDMGGGPPGTPEAELDRIAHIALPFGKDNMLMASDILPSMGHRLTVGNNFYITLAPDSGEEAERLFGALSAGGRVEMPLQPTAWAEKYGVCADRFGVQWMVTYTGSVQFTLGQRG